MTWFADLTPYTYAGDRASVRGAPLLNIGWLARDEPFPVGEVPDAFVERLRLLVEHAPTQVMRGTHSCEFCRSGRTPATDSNFEIRAVAADGTRFAAPGLVHHYVAVHGYRPPQAFIDAVLRVADLSWETAASHDRCLACGAPLECTKRSEGWRGATKEPVVIREFRCPTCGPYQRLFPAPRDP